MNPSGTERPAHASGDPHGVGPTPARARVARRGSRSRHQAPRVSATNRLGRLRPLIAASAVVWLALAGVGCGGEGAAESSEEVDRPTSVTEEQGERDSGIRLDVADWVPAFDRYGWWGVASAGASPDSPVTQSDVGAPLSVPPGTYDLYWLQDYDHRNGKLLLAREVLVEKRQVTTVGIHTGVRLQPEDWVPQLDKSYGWWGAVRSGQPVGDNLVNWIRKPAAIPLPPGRYDLYWNWDYDHRKKPARIAEGVTVPQGELVRVRLDTGVRLRVADWVPQLDASYGWWAAVPSGETVSDNLVNWTRSPGAMPVPPGDYDLYWNWDYDHRKKPVRIAAGVTVPRGEVVELRLDTGIRLRVAEWMPELDGSYGWWGAVPSGKAVSGNLVNWTRSPRAIPLPAGEYDVYWVQDYDHRGNPVAIAGGVTVAGGNLLELRFDTGVRLRVADWVPQLDGSYGWWGLVPVGAEPDDLTNWNRKAQVPLPVPPGTYDVWWKQDYDSQPEKIEEAVTVSLGELVEVVANPKRPQTGG